MSRDIYLDESGISGDEPIAVVAGVIVQRDVHWLPVQRYIDDLVKEYIPEEHRHGFIFHAKDQFHGEGRTIFNSQKFPVEKGREVLMKLISAPAKFSIPIICGHVRRDPKMPARIMVAGSTDPKAYIDRGAYYHASAFCMCALAAEKYMKVHAPADELAALFAEDNPFTKKFVTDMHLMLKGGRNRKEDLDYFTWINIVIPDCLPMRRVVDTVSFQGKGDALFLQLADACAFILRFFFQGRGEHDEYYQALTGNDLTRLAPHHSQWGTPELGLTQGFRIVI